MIRSSSGSVLVDERLLKGIPTIEEFLQQHTEDPVCRLKWFTRYRRYYMLAYEHGTALCWVMIPRLRLQYVDVEALAAAGAERDRWFKPKRLSEALAEHAVLVLFE